MTETITVDLSTTAGQASVIAANGGPVVTIRVTCPARQLPPAHDGTPQDVPGFGRIVGLGPVAGVEVLYTIASIVTDEATSLRHRDGLVAFA